MSNARYGSGEPFIVHRNDQYADKSADESQENQTLEFPEELGELSDDQLNDLRDRGVEAFQSLYKGEMTSDEDLETLSDLRDNITAVKEELATREAARAERKAKADKFAADIDVHATEDGNKDAAEETDEYDKSDDSADDTETGSESDNDDNGSGKQELATRKRSFQFSTQRNKGKLPAENEKVDAEPKPNYVFAAESAAGYATAQPVTFDDAGKIVAHQFGSFNENRYRTAQLAGKHLKSSNGLLTINKQTPSEFTVNGVDATEVLNHAANESRLKDGSLVASGGWCAPSDVMYDTLLELETSEGIFSLPEISVARGGISRTLGANFAELYNDIQGFHYTEAQDKVGDYDGQGGGSKPCYKIECPDFEEFRMDVDGLCITAGLLERRAYPEVIARVVRGALIAHRHRMAARTLSDIEKGSKAVDLTANKGSATESILSAIELQVQHMRYANRLSQSRTLEAVFPYWVKGAIRSDLAKRAGVDLIDVPDTRINAWFTQRGVSAQFVYNWQDINSVAAADFKGWATQLKFLLYPSGSWVRGTNDVITMENVFDSQQFGQNNYTALFTEEGYLVVPMGHDSRVVTVGLDVSGVTGRQIDIALAGTALAASPNPAFAEPTNMIDNPQTAPANSGTGSEPVVSG